MYSMYSYVHTHYQFKINIVNFYRYGILLEGIHACIVENYGEDVWQTIMHDAQVLLMLRFLKACVMSDECEYEGARRLVGETCGERS